MKQRSNKKFHRILLSVSCIILSFSAALALSGCKDNSAGKTESSGPASSPVGSSSYYSLDMKEKELSLELLSSPYQLTCITKYHGIEVDEELTWVSSDTDVITVEDGLLIPTGEGVATVTASCHGKEVSCQVTVAFTMYPNLIVDEEFVGFLLNVTQPYKIDSYVYYNGEKYYGDDAKITYEFSQGGSSVATVASDGTVTPVGYGDAVLTVRADYNGYQMTQNIDISVKHNIETAISLKGTDEVYVQAVEYDGQQYPDSCSFESKVSQMTDGTMQQLTDPALVWNTSDPSVATVSDGVLTAVSAGEVYVWFDYVYQGISHTSEKIKVTVLPYLTVDKTADISIIINKTTMDVPAVSEIFADGECSSINGIYNEYGTLNILRGSSLNLGNVDYGSMKMIVEGDTGIAYIVNADIVSEVLTVSDSKFGFYTDTNDGAYEFYVRLPELENLEALIAEGYTTVDFAVNYSAQDGQTVYVNSKYASELSEEITAGSSTILRYALVDFVSRYDEFSAAKDSYLAKAYCAAGESLSFGGCTLSKEEYLYDLRLDRNTSLKATQSAKYTRFDIKDGVQAQLAFNIGSVSANTTYSLSVKDMLLSEKLEDLIVKGYKTVRIAYYLEYDSELLGDSCSFLDTNGSVIAEAEANKWATVEIDTRSCVFGTTFINTGFLKLNLLASESGASVDYKFYIASAELVMDSDREYEVYGSSTYYYATNTDWSYSDAQSKDIEYGVEVGGKTAIIYDTLELGDIGAKSHIEAMVSPYWKLGITKSEIKAFIDAGYSYLSVNFYIDWVSESSDLSVTVSTSRDSSLKDFAVQKGEWNDLKIDLQYYYDNFDFVNSTGHGGWLKVKHAVGITEYTFAISEITAVEN